MSEMVLHAERRGARGKGYAKRLRQGGKIPGVLYGAGEEPVPLRLEIKPIERLLKAGGRHAVIDLILDGEQNGSFKTILREIQYDPLHEKMLHVDFQHVSMTQTIAVEVPVVSKGTSIGVREKGGVLEHLLHVVELKCLPTEIPEHVEVDLSGLDIGQVIYVRDLLAIDGRIVTDPDRQVFNIVPPTVRQAVEEVAPAPEVKEPALIRRERKAKESP